ncbi:MAG: nitrogen fixation protein [Candidatus Parabeggiatoa sp. nov. 1]|nr:MAG: nitrogen fixation protein [Gammaproteobacteria bacterium]
MKIAITSQNKREITGHAGKCRKFWIYEVSDGKVGERNLLELPKEQSFHESSANGAHPLDDINVLISGGMGMGMIRRLEMKGIEGIITSETEPDKAVTSYLAGTLERLVPQPHHHGHDDNQTCCQHS